jgi:hypothetical protein
MPPKQINIYNFIGILIFSVFCCAAAYAQTNKNDTTHGGRYIKMIESYSQRMLPGVRGIAPTTDYHFILVWKSKDAPAIFYWRGDNGLMDCRMTIVHKKKGAKTGQSMEDGDYVADANHPLKKSDTLEITPVKGGKFPIPKEIPADARNTLFFKTVKSNWLSFPVKKIIAKPDIVMP